MSSRQVVPAVAVVASVWLLLWPAGSGFGRGAAVASGRPHPWLRCSNLFGSLPRLEVLLPKRLQSRVGEVFAVGLVIGTTVMVAVPFGVAVAAGLIGLGWFDRRRGAARTRSALNEALPESIDLCTVVLGSGGTIRDCLEALAARGRPPVRSLASAAVAKAAGSDRLDQALRSLQLELGPGFQPLTGALLLASEQGGSVGVLLARLAVEANASRRRLGELAARRLPVALLVPLVLCSLPAVIVGTVVPLALVALADLDV